MSLETRRYESDLEVRAEGDGRTICGICVPYDTEARIHPGLVEVFRMGAFEAVTRAAHRVKLLTRPRSTSSPARQSDNTSRRQKRTYTASFVSLKRTSAIKLLN
jgi:hypothetical protein